MTCTQDESIHQFEERAGQNCEIIPVVDDGVKNVQRFQKAICFLILDQDLIKFTGSHKEQDGSD
jgi:hypothetical protein